MAAWEVRMPEFVSRKGERRCAGLKLAVRTRLVQEPAPQAEGAFVESERGGHVRDVENGVSEFHDRHSKRRRLASNFIIAPPAKSVRHDEGASREQAGQGKGQRGGASERSGDAATRAGTDASCRIRPACRRRSTLRAAVEPDTGSAPLRRLCAARAMTGLRVQRLSCPQFPAYKDRRTLTRCGDHPRRPRRVRRSPVSQIQMQVRK